MSALTEAYHKWLQKHGVSMYTPSQALGMELLFERLTTGVSQQELTNYYRKHGQEYNKQLRHVAALGWYVATGNVRSTNMDVLPELARDELMLVSVHAPNPKWLEHNRLKRQGRLAATSWEEILMVFKDRGCAVCGEHVTAYDRGHLDATKPYSLDNIVPMCTDCNNWGQVHNVSFVVYGLKARPSLKP